MKQLRKGIGQITAFIMCMMLLASNALADEEGPFPDVPADAAYAEAVTTLVELEILTGDDQGNFNPDKTITRAEAAAIICRMLGVETEATSTTANTFSDVPSSHWAAGYISKAARLGIVSGYGDGKFGPEDSVTQQQIIKMIVCAMDYESKADELGGWFSGYLSVAQELEIVSSDEIVTSDEASRWRVSMYIFNCIHDRWE